MDDPWEREIEAVTDEPYLERVIKGEGRYKICVTVVIVGGRAFECCYTREFYRPCECCTFSADFEFLSTYNTCMKHDILLRPKCEHFFDEPKVRHVWKYSDGTKYEGFQPPPYVFTDFVSYGRVCVTHEVFCEGVLIDWVKKCIEYPEGVHIGVKGSRVRLSDPVRKYFAGSGLIVKQDQTIHELLEYADKNDMEVFIDEGVELIIDEDAHFNGFIWNMASKSKITVERRIFDIEQGIISDPYRNNHGACCGWRGIVALDGSILRWRNSEVNDAEIMLTLPSTGGRTTHLDITNCTFFQNERGVLWEHQAAIVHDFYGNVFIGQSDCENLCYCCYGYAFYINGVRPYVIFPFTKGQPQNVIRGYAMGFRVINTSIRLRNFLIEDLIDNNYPKARGGIYFTSSGPRYRRLEMDYMWFKNMEYAVGMDLDRGGRTLLEASASEPYQSISIEDVSTGYWIKLNHNARMHRSEISNNYMNLTCTRNAGDCFGVVVTMQSSRNNHLRLLHNHIEIEGAHSTVGIGLVSMPTQRQRIRVVGNDIINHSYNTGAGIYLDGINHSVIMDNDVYVSSLKAGIEMVGGRSNGILCNFVEGGKEGLKVVKSSENDIFQNTFVYNHLSMKIVGNCMGIIGSKIARNTFGHAIIHSNYYNNDAITGPQMHTDGPGRTSEVGGDISPEEAGAIYAAIVSDAAVLRGLSPTERADMEVSIYLHLSRHPEWRTSYYVLDSFYWANQHSWIGKVSRVYLYMDSVTQLQEAYEVDMAWDFARIEAWTREVDSLYELQEMAGDSQLQNYYMGQISMLDDQIREVELSMEKKQEEHRIVYWAVLQQLDSALEEMRDAQMLWEEVEYSMLRIILKMLKGDTLLWTDLGEIEWVAKQCPEEYGRGVWIARLLAVGLFSRYVPQESCTESQLLVTTVQESRQMDWISISPIPARDEIVLQVEGESAVFYRFIVYNTHGEVLLDGAMSEDRRRYKIDTRSWREGLYFIRVFGRDRHYSTKVMIVR